MFDRRFNRSASSLNGLEAARASSGHAENLDGVYWLFAEQEARRTDKGVLFESEKFNWLYPSTVQGAVIGTPGTLPPGWELTLPAGTESEVLEVGSVNNIECVRIRVFGVAGGGSFRLRPCGPTHINGFEGENYVYSTFLHLAENRGLADIRLQLEALNSGLGRVALAQTDTLIERATEWARPSTGLTSLPAAAAYVAPSITSGAQVFSGVPLDFQLVIGQPQVEDWLRTHTDAPAPSSPIATYDVPVMRANEILRASLGGLGITTAITCVVIARSAPVPRKSGTYINFNNHARNSDSFSLRNSADATKLIVHNQTLNVDSGSFPQVDMPAPGNRFCAAFAMEGRDMALSVNGGPVAGAISNAALSTFDFVNIGSHWGGVDQIEGWVERVLVWASRKPDAELPMLSRLATWGG